MDQAENVLAIAEHHVQELEERIARQTALVEKLEGAGDQDMAKRARDVLATFETCLELARDHLRFERDTHGTKP